MKVDLINYTGMGMDDNLFAARLLVYTKSTRLEQGVDTRTKISMMSDAEIHKELEHLAASIRTPWEMVDYVWEIKGVTRAFTHQLVRTRTGSYSQQAMRVADMGEFETLVPDTVMAADGGEMWNGLMKRIQEVYQGYQNAAVPNQDARGVLPTNIKTNIIAKFNLRTMADILAKRKNLRAQGEYADVARAMEAAILEVHPWAAPFLNPDRLATPTIDLILKNLLGDRSPVDAPEINQALKELDKIKGTWG